MNWNLARNILLGLGLLALIIGLLLRFGWGRAVLTTIAVVFVLAATLSGNWYASGSNDDSPDPLKANRYLVWGGVLILSAALLTNIIK